MKIKAEKVENNGIKPFLDNDGYYAMKKKKGADFRIMQLTDIHVGGGIWSIGKDKKALSAVKNLVSYAKPDLIIVTGDVSYPIPFYGTINNMKPAKMFGSLMEEMGVPWALVYGNHDWEIVATHKKSSLTKYYSSLSSCLFKGTAEGIFGDSNYILKLLNEDGSINNALVCLDSNAYEKKDFFSGFDKIHDDQVDWYKDEILKLSEGKNNVVPSMAFFHIPFVAFKEAWWKMQEQSPDVEYKFGAVQENDQYFGVPHKKGKMFDEMLKLGSTKGVFCGHDHLNTNSLVYKGIQLTYGMSIDYLAYNGIKKKVNQRGATMINVHDDGTFDCELLPLTTVTGEAKGGGLRF